MTAAAVRRGTGRCRYGKVCHSILGRNWSAEVQVSQVLASVYGLLMMPDAEDTLDTALALQYFSDRELYRQSVISATEDARSKTREQWKAELLDE